MSNVTIKIKYHEGATKLNKIAVGDWIDLASAEDVEMKAGEFRLISFGISMQLPEGYEANIVPRSSTFKNFKLQQMNSYAVIDNSYSGDNDIWKYPVMALEDTVIRKGDRIAQFRINKKQPDIEFIEVETLGNSDRGGFGSTGIR